ncbi:MAG TPA: S-layer homology domain-containing protein, partial [Microcoleus sp.]|nr:S-layer homology domain-containing protein [Microcoleus sp.]
MARDNKIVSGYQDGTFQPTQPVTRTELMAVRRRATEFSLSARGMQPNLFAKEQSKTFSDTQNYGVLLLLIKCLLIVLLLPLLTKWAINLLRMILQSAITRRLVY